MVQASKETVAVMCAYGMWLGCLRLFNSVHSFAHSLGSLTDSSTACGEGGS